jgi:hypothetical protein
MDIVTNVKFPSNIAQNIVKLVKPVLMDMIIIAFGSVNALERRICGNLNNFYVLFLSH